MSNICHQDPEEALQNRMVKMEAELTALREALSTRTAKKERDLEDKFGAMMDLETQRLADDTRNKVMISLKLVSKAGYAEDEAADLLKAAIAPTRSSITW